MLWRFSRRRRGYTSTARSRQSSRCRCYGFRGCAAICTAVSPRAQRRGKAQCCCRGSAIPPAQILKNCLLLTCMVAPCFDIVTCSYLLCGEGRKGSELGQISLIPEGIKTEYHIVCMPVPIGLKQSERIITVLIIKCDINHIINPECYRGVAWRQVSPE